MWPSVLNWYNKNGILHLLLAPRHQFTAASVWPSVLNWYNKNGILHLLLAPRHQFTAASVRVFVLDQQLTINGGVLRVPQAPTDISWLGQLVAAINGVLRVLQHPLTSFGWGSCWLYQCNKWEFFVYYKHPLTSVGCSSWWLGWCNKQFFVYYKHPLTSVGCSSWRCGCPQLSLSLHVQHAVKDLRGALCLAMAQCQQPAQHITQTSVTAHHTHISDSTPHTHQ